jgi:uncharacterized protein YdaU (DUF1376 family)
MSEDKPRATIWMPIFLKDHRATASTFDHTEHSVWTYLKLLLWEHGGRIVDCDKWIARHVRVSVPKWKAMRETILAEWECFDGHIVAPEIVAEYAKAENNIDQKRRAGKASGEARKRTAVQRTLNGEGNGRATASEPRAGGGVGGGDGSKGDISPVSDEEGEPFA